MNILILGRAKSGTTVISKTIQHSIEGAQYHLEPKRMRYFSRPELKTGSHVVKILFSAWQERLEGVSKLITGRAPIQFEKSICIQRDPRDQLISALFYMTHVLRIKGIAGDQNVDRWVEIVKEKEHAPASISFIQLVDSFNKIFRQSIDLHKALGGRSYWRFIINNRHNMYLLRYEDFISNSVADLERYLGFPLSENRDVGPYTRTKRTASYDNWKKFFVPADVELLSMRYGLMFEEFGYNDWALTPVDSLDPEFGSNYIRRVVAEADQRVKDRGLMPETRKAADNHHTENLRIKRRGHARKGLEQQAATPAATNGRPEPRGHRAESATSDGTWTLKKNGSISGWALEFPMSDPVTVELVINGTVVATDVAKRPLKDVDIKRVASLVRCGFRFRSRSVDLSTLRSTDTVKVRIAGREIDLERSTGENNGSATAREPSADSPLVSDSQHDA